MLLKIKNLKKYHAERLILEIDSLDIHENDRIALIGSNGSGKTTLLNIIAGYDTPDEGAVISFSPAIYVEQFKSSCDIDALSGGEEKLKQVDNALVQNPIILLADEPDNHLDIMSRRYLASRLSVFKGAFILVSHDRRLLQQLCNKVLELEKGHLRLYGCDYNDYIIQKEIEKEAASAAYKNYSKEKKRLKKAIHQESQKNRSLKKTPSRMGNSEARLHKMGNQKAKANLDKSKKRLQVSLDKLGVVEKPQKNLSVKVKSLLNLSVRQPIVVEGRNLYKSYGQKTIFHGAEFSLKNGSRTALLGANGSGKSTLLNMISGKAEGISLASGVRIGYLKQHLEHLNGSVLNNLNEVSIHPESVGRNILAGLLFVKNDVYKKYSVLSGGEKIKLALARLLLGNVNVLLLDEPSNFMDIESIKAIEEFLVNYEGTVLFSSHDQSFIDAIATEIWVIESGKINISSTY